MLGQFNISYLMFHCDLKKNGQRLEIIRDYFIPDNTSIIYFCAMTIIFSQFFFMTKFNVIYKLK